MSLQDDYTVALIIPMDEEKYGIRIHPSIQLKYPNCSRNARTMRENFIIDVLAADLNAY